MIFGYFVLILVVAFCARNIAKKKGRSTFGWFWLCFFFPIAFILLLTLDDSIQKQVVEEFRRKDELDREFRKCPYCAEYIKREAKVCKHCGRDVEPKEGGLASYLEQ